MRLFLLFFFLVYGGMHLYAFLKARAALAFNVPTGIVVALFMLVMVAAPFIIRFSEKAGFEFFARIMSYIGYTWLGVLFLFISVSVIFDIYRLAVYSGENLLKKDFSSIAVKSSHAFFVSISLAILISLYGYYEAKNIRTETLRIKTSKIPEEIGRLTIVQISDVHLGLIVREERLKLILDEVRKANPDILVSTGDLVDGQIDNLSVLADSLNELRPRFGKYAVTGNHEFYAGLEQAINFTEQAGFKILRNRAVTVEGMINIAGVDDPQAESYASAGKSSESELLSMLPPDKFTVLLKHRPLIDPEAGGLFDIQLSGHTHKGQIFPFGIITGLYYPNQAGVAKLSGKSLLYVSRGSGTWGPPIRFLAPPEVTVIELVHESE
jgi:uncharacterized protein